MIAIVMPVTRPDVWKDALLSVQEQSHTDWELYIVTPRTDIYTEIQQQLRYWSCKDRVRLTLRPQQEAVEWAQPRNDAMSITRNKPDITHFAFIDDDDIWFPDHLESCLAAYEGTQAIGVREGKRFVVASFFKIRAEKRKHYLNPRSTDWMICSGDHNSIRHRMIVAGEEHSGMQPYLSLMHILNPDTIGATCMFIHADTFFLNALEWVAAWRRDGRPMPGEDLRFAQSMLLNNYIPIWIKTPTCANMNYYGKNYVPSGEPDEVVVLGHYPHDMRDTRK